MEIPPLTKTDTALIFVETLPSLASLSGLTLLISVLIVFIKIFDESHKAFFSKINNQFEDGFKLPDDNPAWDGLHQSYRLIKNSDPISLQLVIIASFSILLLLSIGFCIVFWKPDPLSGYGGDFLKGISVMIVVTYIGSAYQFGRMGIQKNKLTDEMEKFRRANKVLVWLLSAKKAAKDRQSY